MKHVNKMKWFILSLTLILILSACSSSGGNTQSANGGQNGSSGGGIKITLLNSKSEIQPQLEEAAKAFHEANPTISLEIQPVPNGGSPFERASTLYASGNPPTMIMLDTGDVAKFKDRILDLSGEKWNADTVDHALDLTTIDGKNYAFPLAVEGYGFIYNKAVVDKAVGGNFDPSTINTTASLENLFKQIEASGKKALVVSPMDWSLGAHYFSLAYAGQDKDITKVNAFIDDLRAGKVDLASNKVFNGLMDTFDVMTKYNIDQASPLAGTYERGPELLGKGEVGIWFMGNWAWPQISSFDTANKEYGFLPVPISNNAGDYGNQEISSAVSKRIVIDKEKSTPEQQDAAKKFLDWIVYEQQGQDFLVNKANIIPAFKNITLPAADPLGKSIQDYISRGKSEQSMSDLPADHWANVGASMQKYLAKQSDRAALAKEIEQYWTNVKE
ncbi:raffinose/stachyose/melibiose transport system substrate-binding protein [Paenibacillus sophorae]|uniref:ABC transporter substrate-binding protein n=1 Tax=Paenibacillus sophorae TaxID=1333845 RepID=A0A1H8RBS5_9BACL|nr:ABC transporter substrate-binding protein [Paenibacillus sophorae]QWU15032.1 ABC transporter substrate-binding protein [Paenibacillus sophorae]SEO63905.1 raffinose/stachyose/melibiose transport system substrate-binding protein [Paenibacillus sophorae]